MAASRNAAWIETPEQRQRNNDSYLGKSIETLITLPRDLALIPMQQTSDSETNQER